MSSSLEAPFPITSKQEVAINKRLRKVSNRLSHELKAHGTIESLTNRLGDSLGLDNLGMIDMVVEENFADAEWRQKAATVGMVVGLTMRNRLLSGRQLRRPNIIMPTLPRLVANYTGPQRLENAYDLPTYLDRCASGWASREIRGNLPGNLSHPIIETNGVRSIETTALYTGAVCMFAADGLTALWEQAAAQNTSLSSSKRTAMTVQVLADIEQLPTYHGPEEAGPLSTDY
jgi:hypothetical protein